MSNFVQHTPTQGRFHPLTHNAKSVVDRSVCDVTYPPARPLRVLRLHELLQRTGLSRSSVYLRMRRESPYFDPKFPPPIRLGSRAIGFREDMVDSWIAGLAAGDQA
jgi:prophage regulatory protein